ncbi:sphingosine-1-phosphate lyase [Pelomyxa schiedti]|nr:sphingosine-1-phosphate lyase [Pelomyxa schiedti]
MSLLLEVVIGCVITWIFARWCPSLVDAKAFMFKWTFRAVASIPAARRFVDKSRNTAIGMLVEDHRKSTSTLPKFVCLPEVGLPEDKVMDLLKEARKIEENHRAGVNHSGCIYSSDHDHNDLVATATTWFPFADALHSEVYVCARKMEAEIIRMTATMLHGDQRPGVCGIVTSGGTESILLSTKGYRNRAIQQGMDPDNLEILAADSVHSAYVKAAHLLRVKLVRVPVRKPTLDADIRAMSAKLNKNTFLVVASAPSFPHGIVDDVEALAKMCLRAGVGLHVDSCLGGFVLPFAKQLGYPVPNFDFSVEGVTSMSCDTHKYGCAPKGTSVVLFASQELRSHAFFHDSEWPGGLYSTTTLLGSRPGSVVVGTWASMLHKGVSGYLATAKAMLETSAKIVAGLRKIPDVTVLGDPDKLLFVVPFTTHRVSIFKVAEALSRKKWSLNVMQNPDAVHLCVTGYHVGQEDVFISAVETSVREVAENPKQFNSKAPFYAGAALIGDREVLASLLGDILAAMEDTV